MQYVFGLFFIAAWITSMAQAIIVKAWLFAILTAVCFPVGIVHGFSIWLGLGAWV